jgi:hypothetical protein
MRIINGWNDLEPYGIIVLTGEACGLMCRLLCDVTEQGRQILGKCFGIPDMHLAEPWNQGSVAAPHVGSIMLADAMRAPIAIFALLETDSVECWLYDNGTLRGIEPDDPPELIEAARKAHPAPVVRTFRYAGTAGDRNIHVMSGRVV